MALQDLTPQLRTRLRRVEKIVGFFVTLATLLLFAGFAYYIYHTAERKGWFTPKCPYFTYVKSGEGLKVGDDVVLMGFKVGQITEITAEPPGSWYKVYVAFEVRRPYYGYVWTDSKVKIAASGFLGQRELEITTGVEGQPTVFEKGDRISEILVNGQRERFTMKSKGIMLPPEEDPALTERAEKLVTQVEAALPNILGLTNQLSQVLTNTAALTANANALVADVRPGVTSIVARLDTTLTAANTNLTELAGNLDLTLINLANITSNLNAQVQSNDQVLARISKLIVDTDDMIQGLKKHWLLRGVFKKESTGTNAPPAKAGTK